MTPSARDRPSRAETAGVLLACSAVLAFLVSADDSARREHERRAAAGASSTAQTQPAPRPTAAARLSATFPARR